MKSIEDHENLPSLAAMQINEEDIDHAPDEKQNLLSESEEAVQETRVVPSAPPSALPVEYTVSSARKLAYLIIYFVLTLGITLANKAVLQRTRLPWLLTTGHAATTFGGCAALLKAGYFQWTKLSARDNFVLVAFSTLFTVNIAVSNVSLALVSIPFHQVLRSTCPVITILIYRVVYQRTYAQQTYLSMIPLILGVAITTYGDYSFTFVGFWLTVLGVFLAAIKSIASNRLMTGTLKLSALELVFRMSPLAALQCFVYAWASGECSELQIAVADPTIFTPYFYGALILNALTAFALNIVSFETNKVAGALAISVCANLKQSLTILLGVVLFSVQVTLVNGLGMLITVFGAVWYSKIELDNKRARGITGLSSRV